jgi:hypothetical protein
MRKEAVSELGVDIRGKRRVVPGRSFFLKGDSSLLQAFRTENLFAFMRHRVPPGILILYSGLNFFGDIVRQILN